MTRRVVVVADDDREVQEMARQVLAHRDYDVVVCGDGDATLCVLEEQQPALLVLDLGLPKVSGPMVAASMRAMKSRPRLIICSGMSDTEEIARDLEADAVLRKPFVREDLRNLVEKLLGVTPTSS